MSIIWKTKYVWCWGSLPWTSEVYLPCYNRATSLVIHFPLETGVYTSVLSRLCFCISIPKLKATRMQNYWPISLAPCFSKGLEEIILKKYSDFFTSISLQFGFISDHSTTLRTDFVKNLTFTKVLGCFLMGLKLLAWVTTVFFLVSFLIVVQSLLNSRHYICLYGIVCRRYRCIGILTTLMILVSLMVR